MWYRVWEINLLLICRKNWLLQPTIMLTTTTSLDLTSCGSFFPKFGLNSLFYHLTSLTQDMDLHNCCHLYSVRTIERMLDLDEELYNMAEDCNWRGCGKEILRLSRVDLRVGRWKVWIWGQSRGDSRIEGAILQSNLYPWKLLKQYSKKAQPHLL